MLPPGLATDRSCRRRPGRRSPLTAIVTQVSLTAGEPLVRFRTRFDNQTRDHRLQAVFPTPEPFGEHFGLSHLSIPRRPVSEPVDDPAVWRVSPARLASRARSGPRADPGPEYGLAFSRGHHRPPGSRRPGGGDTRGPVSRAAPRRIRPGLRHDRGGRGRPRDRPPPLRHGRPPSAPGCPAAVSQAPAEPAAPAAEVAASAESAAGSFLELAGTPAVVALAVKRAETHSVVVRLANYSPRPETVRLAAAQGADTGAAGPTVGFGPPEELDLREKPLAPGPRLTVDPWQAVTVRLAHHRSPRTVGPAAPPRHAVGFLLGKRPILLYDTNHN